VSASAARGDIVRRMTMPNYPTATIETDHGTIEVELWSDVAPGHVENFQTLARKGFYAGTGFHRVIPGFVIQGGCPTGDGTGGPGWRVKAEFNDRKHVKGVLSMARSAHPDSAGSQFFICLGDAPHLDGSYTAFGKVTKGIEVVDRIAAVPTGSGDRPVGSLPTMSKVTA
jgi:peptidyl-prolyl cis-trans isomerase B (cyclophilin B)